MTKCVRPCSCIRRKVASRNGESAGKSVVGELGTIWSGRAESAQATSDHAAAALLGGVTKSRRLFRSPRRRGHPIPEITRRGPLSNPD